jgi:hypothetical protein
MSIGFVLRGTIHHIVNFFISIKSVILSILRKEHDFHQTLYFSWRAPKSRGETHLRVSQSQVAESWDLEARSRLPTLERGRGSSWEPRD